MMVQLMKSWLTLCKYIDLTSDKNLFDEQSQRSLTMNIYSTFFFFEENIYSTLMSLWDTLTKQLYYIYAVSMYIFYMRLLHQINIFTEIWKKKDIYRNNLITNLYKWHHRAGLLSSD